MNAVLIEPKIGRPTAKSGTIRVLPKDGVVRLSEDLCGVDSYRVLVVTTNNDRQLIFKPRGPYKLWGKGRSKLIRIAGAFAAMNISNLKDVAGEYAVKKERGGFSVTLR